MIIPVNLGKDSYDITLERGVLKNIAGLFALNRKVLIVTDDGVPADYVKAVESASKEAFTVTLKAGERSKTLENFKSLCEYMLANGFTRKDCVAAVGGGVAGDLAGFAAACYMRGIDFYNVPTTLLSQVDSSVGGKTAVDLGGIKNIVGAFHQPKAVAIDPDVLSTLDKRQFACGAAEIIKMAAALDRKFFEFIEAHRIEDEIETAISGALKIKAAVVEADERESGARKALNFGHTLGHGIESATELLHGECVAVGMIPMCGADVKKRIAGVLKREGLPTGISAASGIKAEDVAAAALHDKKAVGGSVVTVRVEEIGSYKFAEMNEKQMTEACMEVII